MADVFIIRYARGFCVETSDVDVKRQLDIYNEGLIQPKLSQSRGQIEVVEGDRYFVYEEATGRYYYIDALYPVIKEVLDNINRRFGTSNTSSVIVRTSETVDGDDVEFDRHTLNIVEPDDSPFIYQNDVVEYASRDGFHHTVLEVQTGLGKAFQNATPVKIPRGWKPIGELKVGDKVIAPDGTATNVIGVHPQGMVKLYTMVFEDGRVIDCCKEHLWKVYFESGRSDVITTLEVISHLKARKKLYIPLCQSEICTDIDEQPNPEHIGTSLFNGTYSGIPTEYLNGSTERRQTLMDSVVAAYGIPNPHGGVCIPNVPTATLAEDVVYLARSLGGIATWFPVNNKLEGETFTVTLYSDRQASGRLEITHVFPAPDEDEATCITVDHPDALFVTKDFIVTHNTAMAMKTIVNIGKRVLLITKAGYIDKWIGDLTAKKYSLSLRPGELVRIKSLSELDTMIEVGLAGRMGKAKGEREIKMIAISSHTLDNWIQESLKVTGLCHFTELLATLGVGMVLYDETHQLFRMNYWSFMTLGAPRVLDLSATLGDEGDDFMDRRYGERVPKSKRYNGIAYDAYIDAYSIYYHTDKPDIIDRMNRMRMYNHTELEKAIMRKKRIEKAYYQMVYDVLAVWYLKERKAGQKALIFFATQKMCTNFAEFLTGLLPDLDVKRFIQGDNYEEFINADIGISTPGKASTAVDIPGLLITLCTVAMGKEKANLQLLGRTRRDRKWGITPKVVYFHCQQLKKHNMYLNRRRKMFQGKVNKFHLLNSQFRI